MGDPLTTSGALGVVGLASSNGPSGAQARQRGDLEEINFSQDHTEASR